MRVQGSLLELRSQLRHHVARKHQATKCLGTSGCGRPEPAHRSCCTARTATATAHAGPAVECRSNHARLVSAASARRSRLLLQILILQLRIRAEHQRRGIIVAFLGLQAGVVAIARRTSPSRCHDHMVHIATL